MSKKEISIRIGLVGIIVVLVIAVVVLFTTMNSKINKLIEQQSIPDEMVEHGVPVKNHNESNHNRSNNSQTKVSRVSEDTICLDEVLGNDYSLPKASATKEARINKLQAELLIVEANYNDAEARLKKANEFVLTRTHKEKVAEIEKCQKEVERWRAEAAQKMSELRSLGCKVKY